MRSFYITAILCILTCGVIDASERAASWQTQRMLGSAHLSLDSIQVLVPIEDPGEALLAAINDLQSVYRERVDGTLLKQFEATDRPPKESIVLKLRKSFDSTGSFRIRRVHSRIIIDAASQEGLANGIYALCSDVLGARWYWPNEIGLEYVGEVPAKFPRQHWVETPAFIQRALYPTETDFGRRNRLSRKFQFNHALAKVFTPALFDAEPEVFSLVHGRKRRPKGSGAVDPQPNLAQPRAVELAAEAALRYFDANPSSRSFSLSINDNVMFDESPLTQSKVEPLTYFRTRPDYTDYVFGFMNAVAKKVFDEGGAWQTTHGEDRYLTALSYYWTEPSPSIEMHPRVMPVLTSDRAQWHDADYRAEDKALIQRWVESGAERIGTWDYYFGAPYPYPRQMNGWIDESIKYLNTYGVDVFYSQLPSAWGLDGAKAWLAAELLWDPAQSMDILLEEYYSHFFGAAAVPMRAFYETAEVYRNANEGKADWIKFYLDEAGIELFDSEVLLQMRSLLSEAASQVVGDPRRLVRVEVAAEAFVFTEVYAAFHQARRQLVEYALRGDLETGNALRKYKEARGKYFVTAKAIVAQPMHARLNTFLKVFQSDPEPFASAVLAQLGQLPSDEDRFGLGHWVEDASTVRSTLTNSGLKHQGTYTRNFLGPELPVVPGWHFDFRPSQHLQVSSAKGFDTGIHVSGADVFSIFRDVAVAPERTYLLDVTLRWKVSPDNRTHIKLLWTDRNGKRLQTDIPLQLPWGASDGAQRIVIPFRSPERAYDVRIHFVSSRQYEGDFLELKSVDFGMLSGPSKSGPIDP